MSDLEFVAKQLKEIERNTEVTYKYLKEIEDWLRKIWVATPSRTSSTTGYGPTEVKIGNLEQLSSIENRLENILDSIRKSKTFDENPLYEIRDSLNQQTKTLGYVFVVLTIQLGLLCLFLVKIW